VVRAGTRRKKKWDGGLIDRPSTPVPAGAKDKCSIILWSCCCGLHFLASKPNLVGKLERRIKIPVS